MRVLLINPPRLNELVGKNPSLIEKHRGFNPPLGILYLAASLNTFSGHRVDVLDAQPRSFTYEQLHTWLSERDYDVVGISAMTFTLVDAFKTAQTVKEALPRTVVVLGGTHVHLFPDETVNLPAVDYAIMGEAERSLIAFLDNLGPGIHWNQVPGLVYRDGRGNVVKNPFSPLSRLDELPFPDRKILDIRNYNSILSPGRISTTIISSRGCPFRCSFCDRPMSPITSHFRFRSAKNLVAELMECFELGIKDFIFYDDTFTVNRKRVLDICEEILQSRLKIRWDIRTRVDLVDAEMLTMLKRAGCAAVHYGVEAGNDRILKVIQKGFTVRQVREAFHLTREIGMEMLAYFMIGLPTERLPDIQDSFQLVSELKPEYAHFTIFSPYPGTELYQMGMERGIIRKDVWREFAREPREDFRVPVWEEFFSREDLYALITRFYKRFYLRPSYWIPRLGHIRSARELFRKARAGLSVLVMKGKNIDQH